MVKLILLYGPPTDAAAFEDHYANTHVPLAAKIPNFATGGATVLISEVD